MGEPEPPWILSGKATNRKKSGNSSRRHKFSTISTCFASKTGWMGLVLSASGELGDSESALSAATDLSIRDEAAALLTPGQYSMDQFSFGLSPQYPDHPKLTKN